MLFYSKVRVADRFDHLKENVSARWTQLIHCVQQYQ